MKTQPECIACLSRQALNTARVATDDPALHTEILVRTARYIASANLEQPPASFSQPAYAIVREVTGIRDPYAAHKKAGNREALQLLPHLRERVRTAPDPLEAALHAAVAGNVIDLGIGHEFELERDVLQLMQQPFARLDMDAFRRDLAGCRRLLYLGDNAGEIVFDMLLVEALRAQVQNITFTVKSGPIINDATLEDALEVGMTRLARVIETGSDDIGVYWDRTSEEFRAAVRDADVIVAKGHGNFETCAGRPENFYFLLKAKCPVVAGELGVRLGDIVFHRNRQQPARS